MILGGNTTFYAGNLIAQQFLEARDWPLGSALAMVVIAALTVVLLIYARALGRQEQLVTGKRLLAGYAVLAYVLLCAPIAVVVVLAFNGGRDVLFWEGFSTPVVRRGAADPGDHGRARAQHPHRRCALRVDGADARGGVLRPRRRAALHVPAGHPAEAAPAVLAGGLLAFTFSFDDFVTSFFVAGVESETLPIYIWGELRFGVTPAINATAAMILGLTLVAITVAYLVLRCTSQGRDAAVPGI